MQAAPPRKVLFIFRSPESSQSALKCLQPSSGMWALLPRPHVTWHQRCRTECGLAVCSPQACVATRFPPCSRLLSSEGWRRGSAGVPLEAAGRCAGPCGGYAEENVTARVGRWLRTHGRNAGLTCAVCVWHSHCKGCVQASQHLLACERQGCF